MTGEATSNGSQHWTPDPGLCKWHELHRLSPIDPADLRHADVQHHLERLADATRDRPAGSLLTLREVGKSHEGRSLTLASIGSGATSVFMWSQMHGDESTHTAVLLDVLSALTKDIDTPLSQEILKGCTLHFLPMLNPDGAERQIRYNAQGIDINRDARRLVTPEGRVLRDVVQEIKPRFGFNLHNQNARTTVAHSHRVASVAVLAPPVDEVESTPPHVVMAMRLALFLYNTSEAWLPGHAARYDADYMPTAFGEWVQTQGAATVLLEGGGWPGKDPAPMVSHHFGLVVEALLAIVRGKLEAIDPEPYRTLPRCGGQLYDWLLQGARVGISTASEPKHLDLAINFARGNRLTSRPLDRGKLVDLGDLSGRAARIVVTREDQLVLPLGVRFLPDVTPDNLPSEAKLRAWHAKGWGVLVGRVELNNSEHLAALAKMGPPPFAPRIGFVLDLGRTRTPLTAEEWERLSACRQWGVLAAIADPPPNLPADWVGMSDLPLLSAAELERPEPRTWSDFVEGTLDLAGRLKLQGFQGAVRDAPANWLLVRANPAFSWQELYDPQQIVGSVIDGCLFPAEEGDQLPAGRWLTPQG